MVHGMSESDELIYPLDVYFVHVILGINKNTDQQVKFYC